MSLPALATIDDIEERLGAPVANEERVESLIRYASSLVRAETGCTFVDEDGNLVDPLPDGVNEVVVGMIERAVDNPAGVTQETTGPFTVSFGTDAAQRIYLTAGDRTILARARCASPLKAVSLSRGRVEMPSGRYWPLGDVDGVI